MEDLDTDVTYLQTFVAELGEPLLLQIFEELRQTIDLLRSDNSDEFYAIDTRMRKYANVDPLNGPVLLEKYVPIVSRILRGLLLTSSLGSWPARLRRRRGRGCRDSVDHDRAVGRVLCTVSYEL